MHMPYVRRRFKRSSLIIALSLALLALGAWLFIRQFAPERHGIDTRAFRKDPPAPTAGQITVRPRTTRPNIVIILADDLGFGDLEAYGGRVIDTPHTSQLAREGIRFTNAYASAPVCSPSRAGLLTGRYPLRSGITTAMQMAGDTVTRRMMYRLGIAMANFAAVDMPGGRNLVKGLPQSEITLAEALQAADYETMAIGKWHLGDFTAWPEFHPGNHGFDHFAGFNGSNDDFPVAFWRDQEEVVDDIGADQAPYTGIFTQEAVGFIERAERPFFLYLAHKDPHLPFFPSENFAGYSKGGAYGDAVEEFDASVGHVLAALDRAGAAGNTIVIVTSDNGPWFEGSAGMLRGRKGQSHEGGFRVPLIVRWPGVTPPNTASHEPTMNFDLFTTCLAAAGIDPPGDRLIDGIDLTPALQGGELPERMLFYFKDYDVEAVRRGPWKLIASASHYTWPVPLDRPGTLVGNLAGARDYTPRDGGGPIATLGTWPMLYDLSRDPGESYDLAAGNPDVTEELSAARTAWMAEFHANPRAFR
jgi:uncharacterized sulfatase